MAKLGVLSTGHRGGIEFGDAVEPEPGRPRSPATENNNTEKERETAI
jgi:hypothetical protein